MLSWIFRHRNRLQVIYGAVAPPPLVGERFAQPPPDNAGRLPKVRKETRPGAVEAARRGVVVLRPMPPRAA